MKAGSDLRRFLRAQASSLAASGVDFGLYALLHYGLAVWYLTATVAGLIAGGVVNFGMNRRWVFEPGTKRQAVQAMRYMLVWSGNMLLNAAGVFVLTEWLHADPTAAKLGVAVVVGFTYNFFLQKNFVFR